ncbi:MAG TPA: type II toxin-antitoxin system VapC family toxin [Thermoanaerobaculia bacterium]|nr:type II toxin-antitoxin system VapC family toxin [Thermoanaerobaculia bacterium]
MRHVVIDTNVLISSIFRRNEDQLTRALELYDRAGNGELVVVFPQFVIFEAIHVFTHIYRFSPAAITQMLRDAMALPGVTIVNDCRWPEFFEHWSNFQPDVGDAAILALAIANRYILATFDHKFANRARTFGVAPYW